MSDPCETGVDVGGGRDLEQVRPPLRVTPVWLGIYRVLNDRYQRQRAARAAEIGKPIKTTGRGYD